MQIMIINDPQQFFKLNLSRKYTDNLPTTMSYQKKMAENSDKIVDLFCQFFQSIYTET